MIARSYGALAALAARQIGDPADVSIGAVGMAFGRSGCAGVLRLRHGCTATNQQSGTYDWGIRASASASGIPPTRGMPSIKVGGMTRVSAVISEGVFSCALSRCTLHETSVPINRLD